jgi:hypothetical protein
LSNLLLGLFTRAYFSAQIIISFCIQAGLAITISFICLFLDRWNDFRFRLYEDDDDFVLPPRLKKLMIAERILLLGSDLQTVTGEFILHEIFLVLK